MDERVNDVRSSCVPWVTRCRFMSMTFRTEIGRRRICTTAEEIARDESNVIFVVILLVKGRRSGIENFI